MAGSALESYYGGRKSFTSLPDTEEFLEAYRLNDITKLEELLDSISSKYGEESWDELGRLIGILMYDVFYSALDNYEFLEEVLTGWVNGFKNIIRLYFIEHIIERGNTQDLQDFLFEDDDGLFYEIYVSIDDIYEIMIIWSNKISVDSWYSQYNKSYQDKVSNNVVDFIKVSTRDTSKISDDTKIGLPYLLELYGLDSASQKLKESYNIE